MDRRMDEQGKSVESGSDDQQRCMHEGDVSTDCGVGQRVQHERESPETCVLCCSPS